MRDRKVASGRSRLDLNGHERRSVPLIGEREAENEAAVRDDFDVFASIFDIAGFASFYETEAARYAGVDLDVRYRSRRRSEQPSTCDVGIEPCGEDALRARLKTRVDANRDGHRK